MKKYQRKSHKRLILVLICLALLLAAGGCFILYKRHQTSVSDTTSKTTSTVKSAQSDFTSDDNTKSTTSGTPRPNSGGGITDTNGSSSTPTDTAQLTSSANGEIIVYSPVKNSMLANGATISGTSSLSKVNYRIVDSQVGVLSTGSLNVVNGKFSGTIQFQTSAKDGKLDFFGTQSDGNEFDNISIPVTFR